MHQLVRTISAILYMGASLTVGAEHALDDVGRTHGHALDARHIHAGRDERAHELRGALMPVGDLDGELPEELLHPRRRTPGDDDTARDEPIQRCFCVETEPGAEAVPRELGA